MRVDLLLYYLFISVKFRIFKLRIFGCGRPSCFIIKFRYNARSDWLKEHALSEYRARSDEGGPISVFASAFWRI